MLYLILHKVRGEPAFDVASPIEVGVDTWWIIPTSGHRAYPYAMIPLSDLANNTLKDDFFDLSTWTFPPDWPDHYTQAEAIRHPKVNPKPVSIEDLLI